MHTEPHYIKEAVAGGALGYVSKQAAPDELISAIKSVSQGEPYFSSDVRHAAISFSFGSAHRMLSVREQEVLRLAAGGFSASQIAAQLGISRRTAEAHRASILKKLALKTQTDVVRYALRHGIISL
jgi:two-component system response regulator NreC